MLTAKKTYTLLIILIALVKCSFSQDIHFSQYMNTPLNLNPAETGSFNGDVRLVSNHKRQWKSFADAYSTFSVSADKRFLKDNKLQPSVGLLINNDIAGDGDFGTFNVELPLSLSYVNDRFDMSVAVAPGFLQYSFDFNAFYFSNQYDGDQFDPEKPSNEFINNNKLSVFDFSSGLSLNLRINDSLSLNTGGAVMHINKPEKSFNDNSEIILPVRWNAYFNLDYKFSDKISILPSLRYMEQGVYKEIMAGSGIRYEINPLGLKALYAGLYLRTKDSGILLFGLDYNSIIFNVSYDINFSGLREISRGRGGVELSLKYIFTRTDVIKSQPVRKCPDFI